MYSLHLTNVKHGKNIFLRERSDKVTVISHNQETKLSLHEKEHFDHEILFLFF